jgi:ferric-dicitrate binding protein FerR (iron transport regulator)
MNRDHTPLETLLKLAGERDQPSPEGRERAREAAYRSWRSALARPVAAPVTRRPWRGWVFAAAASLAAMTAATLWTWQSRPEVLANVVTLRGEVRVEGAAEPPAAASPLRAGDVLRTAQGRVAVSLGDTLSLRLDQATRVRLVAPGHVTLLEGGVYVDSGSLAANTSLRIDTPAGEVRHVGTQFQVRVRGGSTRVQVREGRVLIQRPAMPALDLGLGDTAEISGSDVRVMHGAATYGADWEWVTATAPGFDIENRPLSEFLAWLAREHGWQLRIENADTQDHLRDIRLHGSMDGLDHREMLARAALITGIPMEVRDGVLRVSREARP